MGAYSLTENTPNAPEFISPSPKVLDFNEKRFYWASVVRGTYHGSSNGVRPHTRLTSTKRFTNLKVNPKCLRLYISAKIQLVSYEFE